MRQYQLTRRMLEKKLETTPAELQAIILAAFKAGFTLGQIEARNVGD